MLLRTLTFFGLIVLYFSLWPVAIEPFAWQAPKAPNYTDHFSVNNTLADYDKMTMDGNTGPEGVLVDLKGNVYATTDQGWIVRWQKGQTEGANWVKLPGRPLGMTLGQNNDFWAADAFEGLFHIAADGTITKRLTQVEGSPILYANDLVVAPNGKIYLSDSTTRFSAKAYGSTYKASLVDGLEHGKTGRIIEFDPTTNASRIIMTNLSFANGVTVAHNGDFLLINETFEYRVWKHWLKGDKAGQSEIILDNLPGFPDNITAGLDGRFWLGFTSPRIPLMDELADKPFARKIVQRLPSFVRPKALLYGHILAISGDGKILQNLQDPEANYPLTTGAFETQEFIYISSLVAPYLARIKNPAL